MDLDELRGVRRRSAQCPSQKWRTCWSDYRFKTVRYSERHERKRTDTEVGEDGIEAGERVMSSEFLLGDPREADEGVGMREEVEEKGRNTYGRGKSFVEGRGWSSLAVV